MIPPLSIAPDGCVEVTKSILLKPESGAEVARVSAISSAARHTVGSGPYTGSNQLIVILVPVVLQAKRLDDAFCPVADVAKSGRATMLSVLAVLMMMKLVRKTMKNSNFMLSQMIHLMNQIVV